MGIKIHHGPDGTFKTSGAIKDDILPVIKNGRTLITNVRGFSKSNAIKVLGRKFVHKHFKVIFIDTELQAGRDKLARFYHWSPQGAFFVIDEVQRIFKPSWRQKDLDALKIYTENDKVTSEDRPEDIETAWDMQRHYSWDFVFTTTTITKVRAEMRDMAKVAIRHYNIGVWRFYKTVEHATDSKGTSQSSQGTVKYFNWVPKKIFALYSSTKTGTFTNSEPRTSFYKDPKILGMLIFLCVFWGYLLNKPAPKAVGGGGSNSSVKINSDVKEVSTTINQNVNEVDYNKARNANSDDVSNSIDNKNNHLKPLLKHGFITGSVYSTGDKFYSFESNFKGNTITFNSIDLSEMGVNVKWVSPCKAALSIRNQPDFYIHCSYQSFVLNEVAVDKFQPPLPKI